MALITYKYPNENEQTLQGDSYTITNHADPSRITHWYATGETSNSSSNENYAFATWPIEFGSNNNPSGGIEEKEIYIDDGNGLIWHHANQWVLNVNNIPIVWSEYHLLETSYTEVSNFHQQVFGNYQNIGIFRFREFAYWYLFYQHFRGNYIDGTIETRLLRGRTDDVERSGLLHWKIPDIREPNNREYYWTSPSNITWHPANGLMFTLKIIQNNREIFSRTESFYPYVKITQQRSCDSGTCPVECNGHICCYGSDGIAIETFLKSESIY